MVQVKIVVREIGRLKPGYSLNFTLPEIPRVGEYISIFRPDAMPHTEDMVVRKVWWHLYHGETRGVTPGDEKINGHVQDVMVECEPAIGPYSTDQWITTLEAAVTRGETVERFEVDRPSVRQRDLKK